MPQIASTQPRGALFWKALIFPALLIVLWSAFDIFGGLDTRVFVSPLDVVATLVRDVADWSLPGATLATLSRALTGWAIGVSIGLVAGILLGLSGLFRGLFDPTVTALRQIALFAWIPLLSAWLGNGEGMKITLIALGAFFPMALATQAGCANVPLAWREVGIVLELDRWTRLRRIILPAALPSILTGLELSLNVAWLGTFGAEYLIGTGYINAMGDGLGAYLAVAREHLAMDKVLLGILFLGLIGVSLDRLVIGFSRRATSWHKH